MPPVAFVLLARHSGKCLDVAFAALEDGAAVHQWECLGAANQQWHLLPEATGGFQVVAAHSGKCLDVALASRFDEAVVHQWRYVGGANQQWRMETSDGLFCRLTAEHSGGCLSVAGLPVRGDGAAVIQVADVGGDNQRWLPVADLASYPGRLQVASRLDGRRLAADPTSGRVGLLDAGALGTRSATWRTHPGVAGSYLAFGDPRRAWLPLGRLDGEVFAGAAVDGVELLVLERVGDVFYRIVHRPTGLCLGRVPGGDEREVVCQRPWTAGEDQQWVLLPELAAGGAEKASGPEPTKLGPDEELALPLWPLPALDTPEDDDHSALAAALVRIAWYLPRYRLGAEVPPEVSSLLERRGAAGKPGTPTTTCDLERLPAQGVYLSYASLDRALARRIAQDLRTTGVDVWLDEWEIRVGDSIAGRIQEGLERAAFVVVLLTRHSIASGWVEKEWRSKLDLEARERRVAILPVRGDEAPIPLLLRDRKCADLSRDYRSGVAELIRAIRLSPGAGAEPDETTAVAAARSTQVRFITEGGSNAVYFVLANPEAGRPVVISGVGVKADVRPDALAAIARADLARYFEPEDGNVVALNLSTGDFRLLTRGSVHIAPGEIVPCTLRLCLRHLDLVNSCRLMVRLTGAEDDYFLPSDCVYLLKRGGYYPGSGGGPELPIQLLVRACLPVEEVLRTQLDGTADMAVARIPEEQLRDRYSHGDLARITDHDSSGSYWNYPLSGKV